MKDRHDILKAIDEILTRPDEVDLHRLTVLCWVLEADASWTDAQEMAQALLDTSTELPDRKADNAP